MYAEKDKFYDATLNQSNVTHNNNKFYRIQVLQSDTNSSEFHTVLFIDNSRVFLFYIIFYNGRVLVAK